MLAVAVVGFSIWYFGALCIWCTTGAGRRTTDEKRTLASLEAFFIHALTAPPMEDAPLVDSGRNELLVADREGKPVYSSAEGRRLLYYATHARIGPDRAPARNPDLPRPLAKLCRSLSRIFADDPTTTAPSYRCRNVWGASTFRAQWLSGDDPDGGLIGITVTQEVPLPIRLMRSVAERCPKR